MGGGEFYGQQSPIRTILHYLHYLHYQYYEPSLRSIFCKRLEGMKIEIFARRKTAERAQRTRCGRQWDIVVGTMVLHFMQKVQEEVM
jgi:hypothetical protein